MTSSRKKSPAKSLARARRKGRTGERRTDEAEDCERSQQRKGYGNPPKRHQWRKGQSGNRAGRKKGTKNKRTIITQLMEQKLGRRIDDVSTLSRYEGMLLKGIQKALSGDTKAMAFILRRYDDAEAQSSRAEPVPSEQDEIVYAALVEKIKREVRRQNDELI
jgi:hypothetical protein